VVGFLVLLSLTLITVSFRSSALDPVQGFGASVLRPFEIAANRVTRPFHDAFDWARGLVHAKSENERLRAELEGLRGEAAAAEAARQENAQLKKLLDYRSSPRFPDDYRAVAASVMANPTAFDRSITIAAGSRDGIRVQDVVITAGALVGQVTKVFRDVSRVMLITDPSSAVTALDASNPAAVGILEHGSSPDSLVLSRVTKDKKVEVGDTIVTSGSQAGDRFPSIFPRDLVIGRVASVGQSETDIFKTIQVEPLVDLSALRSVLVLVPTRRGGAG
jgi:rod shape-determining protein MreC